MKKILKSYALSLPALILGIIAFAQASSPSFVAAADSGSNSLSTGSVLIVVGIVFLAFSLFSIIYRMIDKVKR